jgi:hypothetical protein
LGSDVLAEKVAVLPVFNEFVGGVIAVLLAQFTALNKSAISCCVNVRFQIPISSILPLKNSFGLAPILEYVPN